MSDAGTVPVFAPDGTLGDIPYEQLHAAIAAGAKPGVNFTDPSGKPGVIPADQTQAAIKAGGKIVPFQNQETQHPGFWSAIADDMKGLLHPSGFSPYPGIDQDAKSAAAGQSSEQDQARKAAGYSGPYRAIAPVAQAVGVNVPGMEESAKEGDVAGVAGHATAPIAAMAAGQALAHGSAAAVDALSSETGSRVMRTAGKTALEAATDIPVIRKLANAKKNWDATAPEPAPVNAGAPLPATPAPEQLNPALVSEARTLPGQVGAERIYGPRAATAAPIPARSGLALTGDVAAADAVASKAATPAAATPAAATPGAESIPSVPSGETVLTTKLLAMSNENLTRIAKSRGINITQEANLKAGVANPKLIAKIVGDFSDDELDNVRSTYVENTSQPHHDFGDIAQRFQDQGMSKADAVDRAQEVWNALNLKTYFPDVKIPQAVLNRVNVATNPSSITPPAGYKPTPEITLPAGQAESDLSPLLQESLKRARAMRAAKMQATQ